MASALAEAGIKVIGYDPLANDNAKKQLAGQVHIMDSMQACLDAANVILITTPDPEFKSLSAANLKLNENRIILVDFWRAVVDELAHHPNIHYVPIGRSVDDEANAARLQQIWGVSD